MSQARSRFDNSKRRRGEDHERQRMLTPEYVLGPIRELWGNEIGLDPCTEPDNPTRATAFYCLPDDGCTESWDYATVFCNPPYGETRDRWVRRCIQEGEHRKVILLMPSHTDTQICQLALEAADSVLFIRGRLKFGVVRQNGRQEAASHGSILFGFGQNLAKLGHLGVLMNASTAKESGRSH